ncbi:TIGR02302 family protein [uncultured Roseobacter sp.]|uniref:TIGR02302 family protein n=1 Tax=uncultured Roseobacter sp. TaxID=114847 RepID=UPI0026299481|nr:TIGR02302 family protein [uncultured Roseobacter sp.]
MASRPQSDTDSSLREVRWPLRWTRAGMLAEATVQSFWPLIAVCLFVLGLLMLGLQDTVAVEAVWTAAVLSVVAAIAALIYGLRRFALPSRDAAIARLDASLPDRPLQALTDTQTIGAQDAASAAVWRAHQKRMAARAAEAEAVPANLNVASRDPYALRYMAVLVFAVALVFGSVWRVGSVATMAPGGADLAAGPVWEGWAESPRYTGRPTIYLNDIPEGALQVPVGSLITLRLYGELGALTLSETVSGRTEVPPASDPVQDFTVVQDGTLSINGPGGRSWDIAVIADAPPRIAVLGDPSAAALGEMTLPFEASDDYGVEAGEARFTVDLAAVTRAHGLTIDPEPRPDLIVPLPTPISGNRRAFEENLIEDFSTHPWANLPVLAHLSVLDGAEQRFETEPHAMVLPGRRFFDPVAAAVIEQRRDLLWSRENTGRIAQILRAAAHLPDQIFRKETDALRLRKVIRQLETFANYGLSDEMQQDLADEMWDLALTLEEGDLADAEERMRRAQERLDEAIRNGASDEEIAELMRELRRATEDYLQQMMRQAERQQQQNDENRSGQNENTMTLTQDDIQRMMDRIQELMEQGRMAEAQQALQELQEMMENMRAAQSQPGQGGQSPGEQAMEGLSETLREQQGLSDQAFRDLQEQFNPGARAGESQENEGRNGGEGRGQSHEGQSGQGQGQADGQQGAPQPGEGPNAEDLAQRQQALRDELRRQQDAMPGGGTPEGDAARDALDHAGRAMEDAEESLRNDDLAEAIDDQSEAMEALREGMRSLGEMMAQQQQNQQPGQGNQRADGPPNDTDPLGRERDGDGQNPDNGSRLADGAGTDPYGRARDLLDDIRRRAGEADRSEEERDYLNRLLDRF